MSAILTTRPSSPWMATGSLIAALVIGVLLLHYPTVSVMVEIWSRSDTFAHCFLVPPIALWLIWRQRAEIAAQPPAPVPWMLIPMAGVGLLWMLGNLASTNAVSQFALVLLVVLLVPTLAGFRATKAMLFPLGFLFFSVPVGEFLLPSLMSATADFTVTALRLTGIPVFREGNQFVIPSGNWSVVEACSGVRYLIASLMVGLLFAYLNYRSLSRRWIFAGVALVVPILANWLRAYFIVLLGHYSDNKLAAGADHLIYGWVFFGIVISLMFMIGSRWSEPDLDPSAVSSAPSRPLKAIGSGSMRWGVPVTAVAVLLIPVLVLQELVSREDITPPRLGEPSIRTGVWTVSGAAPVWTPAFVNPSATINRVYVADGRFVGLYLGYYRQQVAGGKLVSSKNALVGSNDKEWIAIDTGSRRIALTSGGEVEVRTVRMRRPPASSDPTSMVVWQTYWVNGRYTTGDAAAKAWGAVYRLLGRGDDGAVVVAHAIEGEPGSADALLESFVRDGLDAIDAQLRKTRDDR